MKAFTQNKFLIPIMKMNVHNYRNFIMKKLPLFCILTIGFVNTIAAQCNGGKIRVDTALCSQSVVTLRLTGHTAVAGTTYQWQLTNGGPFFNMAGSSGADTQNINPGLVGRAYRCIVTCASGTGMSDTLVVQYVQREVFALRKICATVAGGKDTIVLGQRAINAAQENFDTAIRKKYLWRSSTTAGNVWSTLANSSSDSIKVPYSSTETIYNVYITLCPITDVNALQTYNAVTVARPVNVLFGSTGSKDIKIAISNRECNKDTVKISPDGDVLDRTMLIYNWQYAITSTGPFASMGVSDTFLRDTVRSTPAFYRLTTKLCPNPNLSGDSAISNVMSLWPKLNPSTSPLTLSYNCITDQGLLEYQYRDSVRSSFFTDWVRSVNDSLNPQPFTAPADSLPYYFTIQNKTNYYYKVYSRFCPGGKKLDSTYFTQIFLNVDTGQLQLDTVACANDSIYMQLVNYNASASFPLVSQWEWLPKDSMFWTPYTRNPQTNTSASFRMQKGWTSFRKTTAFCPGRYATKLSSTLGRTFLPFELVFDSFNCTTGLTLSVNNDTPKIVDYRGTKLRNGGLSYQWLTPSGIISGQSGKTLAIANAAKNIIYRRLMRFCPTSSIWDTTNASLIKAGTPNAANGKADAIDEICLNRIIRLTVPSAFTRGTDVPTYVWQISDDDFNWRNMTTADANRDTISVLVTAVYKYYRRITIWCPSGIIDSTISAPIVYNKGLGCETFDNTIITGANRFYNCWSGSNYCASAPPTFGTNPIFSRPGVGKTGIGMSHRNPPMPDPGPKTADFKLYLPAYELKRGKAYRFSFWHKEDAGQNWCWDSLYMTVGKTPTACENRTRFGEVVSRFHFDQWNKFWSDFVPEDDGIYYVAINYREATAFNQPDNIVIDDVCIKEIDSCNKATSITTGTTFAPSKIIDRSENPSKAQNYDKTNVTHQYCLWDTIMLTYQEQNYENNFDYYGMKYQFWKKREDFDWKVTDTFFKKVPGDPLSCHLPNRTDYHTMNVMVTDTHTWYKIVATCEFNGKTYHADSLLVNGTHSLPYCEDWEFGDMQNQWSGGISGLGMGNPFGVAPPNGNSGQIIGQIPSFSNCPTCWSAFPQPAPPAPNANDISLCTVTLPFRNTANGVALSPQMNPDGGYAGNNVVMITDNRAVNTGRNILVTPAVRLHKGRAYRITARWTDNRTPLGSASPNFHGNPSQRLDTFCLIAAKGNRAGGSIDSFTRNKRIGTPELNLKSNILEVGQFKYKTFWRDFTPVDTGTYFFAFEMVPGTTNGGTYRFYMDYFCIDTLSIDTSTTLCLDSPKFKDPLAINVSPNGKSWTPLSPVLAPPFRDWCLGASVDMELTHGLGANSAWKYGWQMEWQRNTNKATPVWTPFSNSNRITYTLTNKYQEYRLVLKNACNQVTDVIGPIVGPTPGQLPWKERFDPEDTTSFDACWLFFNRCRLRDRDIPATNFGRYGARSNSRYLDWDFESTGNAACPPQGNLTAVPPAFPLNAGVTYRFSLWYKDNGISQRFDSLRLGYNYDGASSVFPQSNILINRRTNDIARNFREENYRYYTGQFTATLDTAHFVKIQAFAQPGPPNRRVYRLLTDDMYLKAMNNIDLVVTAIDSPLYDCGLGANTTVKVEIMNIGFNSVSNIPVSLSVQGGPPVTVIHPGPLGSNQTAIVRIPNVNFPTYGPNKATAWTDLPTEMDRYDDSLTLTIYNNNVGVAPTDTVDSLCVGTNYTRSEPKLPGSAIKWYKRLTDAEPFYVGDTLRMNNVTKDTCFFRSLWSGNVCYSDPQNLSQGIATYSTSGLGSRNRGLTFDNVSKDTLIIDSVTIWANSVSNTQGRIVLTQFATTNPDIDNKPFLVTQTGRQTIYLGMRVPPGTDYKLIVQSPVLLAALPTASPSFFLYIERGCKELGFNIVGDLNYPNIPAIANYDYLYNMKIIKPGCETSKTPMCIKTVQNPTFNLYDTTRVCSAPEYSLCGPTSPPTDAYTYSWDHGPTSQCVPVNITQNYMLTVTNAFGCTATNNRNITVDPSPTFSLGPDSSFCQSSTYQLITGLNGAQNFASWARVGDTSYSASGVTTSVTRPGTYIATAYNKINFCKATDTISLIVKPLPLFSMGQDRVICANSTDLSTSLPSSGFTWVWGTPNLSPVVTDSGKYWVRGKDNVTGCENSDTILVNLVKNPIVNLGPDRLDVCGPNTTVIGPVGRYTYKWSTTATTRNLLVSTPGTYILTVTDSLYGCTGTDTINISFKQIPTFNLGPDTTLCSTGFPVNGPMGAGLTYTWSGPGNKVGSTQSILADVSGDYCLTVSNGCYTFSDCRKVTLRTPASAAMDLLKSDTGCGQVVLTVTSKPTTATINWGVGIPASAASSNTQIITKSGAYSVTLSNACGFDTKSVYVRVDTTPVANFDTLLPTCMSVAMLNRSSYATQYHWDFGDGNTSNLTNPLHIYSIEGIYLISLQAKNSCGVSSKSIQTHRRSFNCGAALGIANTLSETSLKLYPNPTQSSTALMGEGVPNGNYDISIKTILGQEMQKRSIKVLNNRIEMILDLSTYASGDYLITISNESETIVQKVQLLK